jgi:hypothetical protein
MHNRNLSLVLLVFVLGWEVFTIIPKLPGQA